jgi:hypothetical protein
MKGLFQSQSHPVRVAAYAPFGAAELFLPVFVQPGPVAAGNER